MVSIALAYLIWHRLTPAAVSPDLPTPVEVTYPSYKNIPVSINTIGTLIAPEATMLKAREAGVVQQILFSSGQKAKKNQLLLQFDATEKEADYQKAEAVLIQTKADYQRYQRLQKEAPEILAQTQIDQVFSTYQQAYASINVAKKELANMQVRAPFAGILGSTTLAVGSYVNQGDSIVAIVNRDSLEVSYNLPESFYGMVQVGQMLSLTSDAFPGKTFTATVDYIAPLINQQNRAFSVRAKIDNHEGKLSPGMLVNLTQILNPNHNVLTIPAISLITDMSGYGVYTVKDNKVLQLAVKVGNRSGNFIEITSGLDVATPVISAGQEKVQPGSSVKIINTSAP